jgi:hypothetical protein
MTTEGATSADVLSPPVELETLPRAAEPYHGSPKNISQTTLSKMSTAVPRSGIEVSNREEGGLASHQRAKPSKEQALQARLQFASCCLALFLAGWNDGTTGPLLPRIQEVYNVGFREQYILEVLH